MVKKRRRATCEAIPSPCCEGNLLEAYFRQWRGYGLLSGNKAISWFFFEKKMLQIFVFIEIWTQRLTSKLPKVRVFLESILQHDPKTIQMDLVMGPTWAQNGIKNRHCAGKEHFLERTWLQQHNIACCGPPLTPHNLRWANASSYV